MKLLSLFASVVLVSAQGTASAESLVRASYYQCCSHKTASGYPFSANNPRILAHKTLPFGTHLKLTNVRNGRTLVAVVLDRGPYSRGVQLDVSRAGAQALGFQKQGTALLRVVRLD